MQNTRTKTKRNTYKTKNSNWDECRQHFVSIPVVIYQYTIAIKCENGWQKGDTPKRRAFYALKEFLGRTPTESELKQVTKVKRMTESPTHFALALFSVYKGVPFNSLQKYYFYNKAWQNVRAQLRKALKLGVRERYVLEYSVYERYSYSILPTKYYWWRVGKDKIYGLRDVL